ncbi:low specificity L-threonine aldolase [uncultured Agrococcus sp.]|uniref:threonine aldolase family protein n=1 Tax=uncultured Agrococcus sp. TaxID=382258 RepID=UPI0025F420D7|nr:low specificity L-threonine aldolase [uncultured Agrococcus sp.]
MVQIHNVNIRGFASDNYSGVHPEILEAIAAANEGHQSAYGSDAYTERLQDVLREHFGPAAQGYPVFNGTGANVVALQATLPRWGAVVAASSAHIHVDECGAPERVGGMKLLTVPTPDGKLTPELVDREAWGWGDEHRAQPLTVSITQSTELGTLYTADEIRALADHAHDHGMLLHVDGARLPNAAVALESGFAEFTTDAGVDILSLGGTKNGAMGAEAVVVLSDRVPDGLVYLRKMNMQLASKMRFISAQLVALYGGDLWHRNATHANAMAARLRTALEGVDGVEFAQHSQANGVFARLPEGVADRVREHFFFYDWDAAAREVRWMCNFDTREEDIDSFAALVRDAAGA